MRSRLRTNASLAVRTWDSRTSIGTRAGGRYQPQQSVLKRHEGQRHTACMRYMSAPQRSHFIASSAGAVGAARSADTTGVTTNL
jgi:hypothetical protein